MPTVPVPVTRVAVSLLLLVLLCTGPALEFTAKSLAITVDAGGDATAVFRYELEGFVENAIPTSLLEEEMKKGLSTSSEPPEVVSFDRSEATLLMRGFAQRSATEDGTEYLTATMDFTRAEIALKESALSAIVSADFTPQVTTVLFPDGYRQEYSDQSALPAIRHTVIDPARAAAKTAVPANGILHVTSTPSLARVFLDAGEIGNTPVVLSGIVPGPHTIRLEREGYVAAVQEVSVEPGANTTVSVTLLPETDGDDSGSGGFPHLPGFSAISACISLALGAALLLFKR